MMINSASITNNITRTMKLNSLLSLILAINLPSMMIFFLSKLRVVLYPDRTKQLRHDRLVNTERYTNPC
jgi:hypothetical protein